MAATWEVFLIRDREKFVRKVMPIYFKQTHFTAFQRQLNLYGFLRTQKKGRTIWANIMNGFWETIHNLLTPLAGRKEKEFSSIKDWKPKPDPDFFAAPASSKPTTTEERRNIHAAAASKNIRALMPPQPMLSVDATGTFPTCTHSKTLHPTTMPYCNRPWMKLNSHSGTYSTQNKCHWRKVSKCLGKLEPMLLSKKWSNWTTGVLSSLRPLLNWLASRNVNYYTTSCILSRSGAAESRAEYAPMVKS